MQRARVIVVVPDVDLQVTVNNVTANQAQYVKLGLCPVLPWKCNRGFPLLCYRVAKYFALLSTI